MAEQMYMLCLNHIIMAFGTSDRDSLDNVFILYFIYEFQSANIKSCNNKIPSTTSFCKIINERYDIRDAKRERPFIFNNIKQYEIRQ